MLLSTGIGNTLAYGSCDETYYGRLIGYYHTCFTGPYPENVDESQRDQAPRDFAIEYIEDHLSRVPLVAAARVGRLWGVFKPGQTTAFDWWIEGRGRVPSWISLFAYYAMVPFAIGGLVVMRRRRIAHPPGHRADRDRHLRGRDHLRHHALPRAGRGRDRARGGDRRRTRPGSRCAGGARRTPPPRRSRCDHRAPAVTTSADPTTAERGRASLRPWAALRRPDHRGFVARPRPPHPRRRRGPGDERAVVAPHHQSAGLPRLRARGRLRLLPLAGQRDRRRPVVRRPVPLDEPGRERRQRRPRAPLHAVPRRSGRRSASTPSPGTGSRRRCSASPGGSTSSHGASATHRGATSDCGRPLRRSPWARTISPPS